MRLVSTTRKETHMTYASVLAFLYDLWKFLDFLARILDIGEKLKEKTDEWWGKNV